MIDLTIPSTISVGPVDFHLYGALLGIGFTIIYLQIEKRYKGVVLWSDYLLAVFLTMFGARLVFVFHNISRFINSPLEALDLSDGGLAYFGAILGAMISVLIISKNRKLKFLELADTILLVAPITQSIGRVGNFINQELYGLPSNLPWAIYIEPDNRLPGFENYQYFHPTFLYEILLNLLSFLVLRKIKNADIRGRITAMYLINYGIIRLLINRIRIDKEYLWLIETSDLFSILFLILGTILLAKLYNSKTTS